MCAVVEKRSGANRNLRLPLALPIASGVARPAVWFLERSEPPPLLRRTFWRLVFVPSPGRRYLRLRSSLLRQSRLRFLVLFLQ